MTYAFTFDASACSGCKACQIACKDKNNLPAGVLWRRVYEVSGGTWQKQDEAWITDVFAYNLSIACNHCVHPKCAGVCPTDAYVVRPDGIVYIDESKCMGCGYCAWACPYSAPRYNPDLRHMTKCNFCYDNLDAGLPPACVAACPLRVLDFVEVTGNESLESLGAKLWELPGTEHPFPLPTFSRTQPHLALQPHAGMLNGLEKKISNQEEVKPPMKTRQKLDELPLIIFTLCGQMAAGMAVFALFDGPLTALTLAMLAGLIGVGGLASLLHLGMPLNAWRALNHLNKSWLSREILLFGLFGVSWLVALALPGMGKLPLALTGLGLVYAMSQVYRFKAAPTWNTWHTEAAFFLSAGTLGLTGMALGAGLATVWFPLWVLLAAQVWLALSGQGHAHETVYRLRVGGNALTMIGIGILPIVSEPARMWLSFPIFLMIFTGEVVGRWLFYELKNLRVV
jgi:anaerobic dimethyl sulfoxide reductase subunit B (iron-sulfur subunit)